MKTKLINQRKYWLLIDIEDEIKTDMWSKVNVGNNFLHRFISDNGSFLDYEIGTLCKKETAYDPSGFKIIAHLPKDNNPKLKGVALLPKLPRTKKEDVGQLAEELYPFNSSCFNDANISKRRAFTDGYNKAKESEKKYSEEDLLKAFNYQREKANLMENGDSFDDFKRSLNTPKQPIDFEVEMEEIIETTYLSNDMGHSDYKHKQPKVIKNTVQGKWIYK